MDGFGRGWGAVCWWGTFLVMFVVCGLGRAVAQGFGGFGCYFAGFVLFVLAGFVWNCFGLVVWFLVAGGFGCFGGLICLGILFWAL